MTPGTVNVSTCRQVPLPEGFSSSSTSPDALATCFSPESLLASAGVTICRWDTLPCGTCLALLKSHLKTRLSCRVDKKQINNNNNPICFLLRAPCSLHPICSVLPGLWASRVVSPADGCCQPASVPCVPLLAWPLPSPTQNLFSEQGEKCKWKAARVLFHLFSAQALMSFERLSYSNCWN